jgi:hypothetical protein
MLFCPNLSYYPCTYLEGKENMNLEITPLLTGTWTVSHEPYVIRILFCCSASEKRTGRRHRPICSMTRLVSWATSE